MDDRSLQDVAASAANSPTIYAGYLEKDAETYGVAAPTVESMSRVLTHRRDDTVRVLDPRDKNSRTIEGAGLRLSISVTDVEDTPEKMSVLTIENLTDRDLAYRVLTRPDPTLKICLGKVHLQHNAMAIRAGQTIVRSECLYKRRWTVEVQGIETLTLPELSYYYVSKVPPEVVGIPPRLSRGHQPATRPACNVLLPATIRNARDRGDITWRDFIDFYARHRCETYRFPERYRAFASDGQTPLPASPSP